MIEAKPHWPAWLKHQFPYTAFAYAYMPITFTKRVLLNPRGSKEDPMVRRFASVLNASLDTSRRSI